jgi:hypothetical protein
VNNVKNWRKRSIFRVEIAVWRALSRLGKKVEKLPRFVVNEIDGAPMNEMSDQRTIPPLDLKALFHHVLREGEACLRSGASRSFIGDWA